MTFSRPPSEEPNARAAPASPATWRRALVMLGVSCAAGGATWMLLGESPRPKPSTAVLQMTVTSDDRRALAKAEVTVAGRTHVTDENGKAQVTVRAPAGATVPIRHNCPPGYRARRSPPPQMIPAPSHPPRVLNVQIECDRVTRVAAVLVRALARERTTRVRGRDRAVLEGSPFPVAGALVVLDGQVAARTDAEGFAHVALERPPGTKVDLLLRAPELVEAPPAVVQLAVGSDDDVHSFERTFTLEREIVERVRRRRPAPPPPEVKKIRIIDDRGGAPFQEL